MPITLKPPPRLPAARILLFGKEGTGKTNSVLSIARRIPTAHFYVVDTDYSASYDLLLATEFEDVAERGNVTTYVTGPYEWEEQIAAVREITSEIGRDDWLIVDSMSPTWSAVQGWFTEQVHANTIEDYLLEIRKKIAAKGDKKSSLEAFDGWLDWSVINPLYDRFYRMLLRQPGNLILTAEAQPFGDKETKATRDQYGHFGVKPGGQKRLGFLTSTVLLTTKGRSGDYALSTVKDRGREEVEDMDLEDFGRDYLMRIAGWKPTKYEEGED